MAKDKKFKRITISLTEQQSETIETMSKLLECPQSKVVDDILEESLPRLKTLIRHFEDSRDGKINPVQLGLRVLTDSFKMLSDGTSDFMKTIEEKSNEKKK